MENARQVAKEYLRRLEANEIKKEHLPNQGDKLTDEELKKDVQRYDELLKSDFFAEVCKM